MEVQRYPGDFDGVIGGHPATGTPMRVGRAIVYQHMLASPDNLLTAEKIELADRATLAACDKSDGLVDGLVTDPRACSFNVDTLACSAFAPGASAFASATADKSADKNGADGPGCLTAGQVRP